MRLFASASALVSSDLLVVDAVRAFGTLHGRVLALWSLVLGGWLVAQNLDLFGASWHGFLIGFVTSAVFVGFAAVLVRHAFRRAVARPLPRQGVNGWLARRPWRVVALTVVAYLVIPAAVFASEAYLFPRPPAPHGLRLPAGFVPAIGGWVTFAAGMAAFWLLVFRQQHLAAGDQAAHGDRAIGPGMLPDQG
jgi:hypothetical protein